MSGYPVFTDGGMWTVDGVDMICPAWWAPNIAVLWQGPTVITSNRAQAGGVGRKAYPPIVDETKLSLRFCITGDVDKDGNPYDDPLEGLELNYFYLRANVFDPVDPVRTSTLITPSGTELTALIQFDPFPLPAAKVGDVEDTLTVTLPEGAHWPETGS